MWSTWDKRYWRLAQFVSEWSKDPQSKVGAVVTTPGAGAIALGYNGFPAGVEDRAERLTDSEIKLEMVIHAEQNALLIAGPSARGGVLYVYGKPVCSRCAGIIIQAGVARVVTRDPTTVDENSKWRKTGLLAVEMMREADVTVDFMGV
jgi:dCMP deaminase